MTNPHQDRLEQTALDFLNLVQGNSDVHMEWLTVNGALGTLKAIAKQWSAWEVSQELKRNK